MSDAATGQEAFTLQVHTEHVESVCFSPDGKRLAVARPDGTIMIWTAATPAEVARREAARLKP